MDRTNFIIMQDGQVIGNTAIKEEAVSTAQIRAAESGKPVSVVIRRADKRDREAIFNPDGSSAKIWNIDDGRPFEPVIGKVYTNSGGGQYRCLDRLFDDTDGFFQNIKSGWAFIARGLRQYIDGTIEWDYSVSGRFMDIEG